MTAYIIRRLLLVIPTLLGIMVINFFIVQTAPGGPVEQVLARIQHDGPRGVEKEAGDHPRHHEIRPSGAGPGDENRGDDYRRVPDRIVARE